MRERAGAARAELLAEIERGAPLAARASSCRLAAARPDAPQPRTSSPSTSPSRETQDLSMQADRFTIKSQEAVAGRAALAARAPQPAGHARAPARRAARPGGRLVAPRAAQARRRRRAPIRAERRRGARRAADARRRRRGRRRPSSELVAGPARGRGARCATLGRRVHLDRAPAARARRPRLGAAARILRAHGATRRDLRAAVAEVRGPHRVTDQNPEEQVPGAREVRPRPDRSAPSRASSTR